MHNRILLWIRAAAWELLVCWAVAIIGLSSLSGEKLNPLMLPIFDWDKICHAIAFGFGAIILVCALKKSTAFSWTKILWIAVAAISIFGMTDEWHQLYTPGRSGADVWDWLADTVGATLGAFVTYAGHHVKTGARAVPSASPGD